MNERQRTVPTGAATSSHRYYSAHSGGRILGDNWKRISTHGFFCYVSHLFRCIWKCCRGMESETTKWKWERQHKITVIIHLLTITVTVSYVTLAVASENTSRIWWIYAITVGVLAVIGLILDKKNERNNH